MSKPGSEAATRYTPEMGQAVFGQPYKEYAVPAIWEAALGMLREEVARVLWNEHQEHIDPFGNTGHSYKTDAFEVEAYSWGDEEQPYNFKWRDVEISWYKYLGRGMSANRELDATLANHMLEECLESITALEEPNE